MNKDKFSVSLDLRLDWSEMDIFGHINNVMFMKFLQASRVNYWETIGMSNHYQKTGIGPMLVSTSCQFKKALHYPGNITVQAKVVAVGNTSFTLNHRILNEQGDVCATGEDVVVLFDFKSNQKVTIPDSFREEIKKVENN